MAMRKHDQSPTILKFFRPASPKESEGSSSEGVKSAKSETRPTLKTAVIDRWVNGWSLLNLLSLEAGYGPGIHLQSWWFSKFYTWTWTRFVEWLPILWSTYFSLLLLASWLSWTRFIFLYVHWLHPGTPCTEKKFSMWYWLANGGNMPSFIACMTECFLKFAVFGEITCPSTAETGLPLHCLQNSILNFMDQRFFIL